MVTDRTVTDWHGRTQSVSGRERLRRKVCISLLRGGYKTNPLSKVMEVLLSSSRPLTIGHHRSRFVSTPQQTERDFSTQPVTIGQVIYPPLNKLIEIFLHNLSQSVTIDQVLYPPLNKAIAIFLSPLYDLSQLFSDCDHRSHIVYIGYNCPWCRTNNSLEILKDHYRITLQFPRTIA